MFNGVSSSERIACTRAQILQTTPRLGRDRYELSSLCGKIQLLDNDDLPIISKIMSVHLSLPEASCLVCREILSGFSIVNTALEALV